MVRLAAVVVIAVVASASAGPRSGRVVRIERHRGVKIVPKLCDVQPTAKSGICVGQPTAGERIALIDHERAVVIGEFRIDAAAPATDPFICTGNYPVVFKISGLLTAGDPDVLDDAGRIIGLRNLALDPKVARVLKDQTVPGTHERAELAVDIDGNGSLDYMLVRYNCDENNNPSTTDNRRFCFDTYLERAGKLVKAHTDNIQVCY